MPWGDSLSNGLSHLYCPLLWMLVDVWLGKDSRTSGAWQLHLRKRTSKECGRKDQLMTNKGNLGTREQWARHPGNSKFQVSGHFPFLPLLTTRKRTCSFLLMFLFSWSAGLCVYRPQAGIALKDFEDTTWQDDLKDGLWEQQRHQMSSCVIHYPNITYLSWCLWQGRVRWPPSV